MQVLSPAGNFEKLLFAIKYGADEVYLGYKKFSLRAKASGFSLEELKKAVDYAHKHNTKVFLTLNIFAHNKDIEEIEKFLKDLKSQEIFVDAFIISDLGVFSLAQEYFPEIPIHISTQANVCNYKTIEFYKKLGAKRVNLARELSLKEIKEIREKVKDMELELFGHGAMCVAYSGRCLLSYFLNQVYPNKGECTQVCRFGFYLFEKERFEKLLEKEIIKRDELLKHTFFFLEDDEEKRISYILNSKDLWTMPILDKIFDLNIDSLKIEGRMKSSYYVALTTAAYKQALLDLKKSKEIFKKNKEKYIKILLEVSHRPYHTGFLEENPEEYIFDSKYIKSYKFLGYFQEDGFMRVKDRFKVGDIIEAVYPSLEIKKYKVREITRFHKGEAIKINEAHPNFMVKLKLDPDEKIEPYIIIRKKQS